MGKEGILGEAFLSDIEALKWFLNLKPQRKGLYIEPVLPQPLASGPPQKEGLL